MNLVGKLIGLGVLSLVGIAAVKVAKKYDENKKAEACAADFVNEEGNTIVKDVKKATKDVYQETAEKVSNTVKNAAENVGINTEEVSTAFGQAGTATVGVAKAVAHAGTAVASKVKKEAPAVIEGTVNFVSKGADKIKNAVTPKDQELEDYLVQEEVIIIEDNSDEPVEQDADETEEIFLDQED